MGEREQLTFENKYKHLVFQIGELLVRNSKWELEDRECINRIRSILQEQHINFD